MLLGCLCLRTGLLIFFGVLISKNKLMYHGVLCTEGIAAECMSTTFSPFSHSHHQAVTTSHLFMKLPVGHINWYHQMSQIFFSSKWFILSSFFRCFCLLHNLENSNISIRKEVVWNGWNAWLKSWISYSHFAAEVNTSQPYDWGHHLNN